MCDRRRAISFHMTQPFSRLLLFHSGLNLFEKVKTFTRKSASSPKLCIKCHSVFSTFICRCLQFLHAFLEFAAETRCPVLWRQCRSVVTANSTVQSGRPCTVLTGLSYALVKGTLLFHVGHLNREKANRQSVDASWRNYWNDSHLLSFSISLTQILIFSFTGCCFFVFISANIPLNLMRLCAVDPFFHTCFFPPQKKNPCHLPKYFHRPHWEWVVFTDSELMVVGFFVCVLFTCKQFIGIKIGASHIQIKRSICRQTKVTYEIVMLFQGNCRWLCWGCKE